VRRRGEQRTSAEAITRLVVTAIRAVVWLSLAVIVGAIALVGLAILLGWGRGGH
jgi:hypothetical protein